MTSFEEWDRRTETLLEEAYLAGGGGPVGSGSTSASEGEWRAKRQHLAIPMDSDGSWLDIGCANGHLLVTLPNWTAERGIAVTAYGLELLPRVAALARTLHPELEERVWTGSVMSWTPPMQFRYVTAPTDVVPEGRLKDLVERLATFVEPGGRLIVSSYGGPTTLFEDLSRIGHSPDGVISIDRPGRRSLITAWLDS